MAISSEDLDIFYGFKLEGCLRQDTQTRHGIFDTLAWGLLKNI